MEKENNYTGAKHYKQMTGLDSIPDNVAEYLNKYHSNLQFNCCVTDVEKGYGQRVTRNIQIMRPFNKCQNCGYHSLWNPDDDNSRCLRHTYTKGWDVVFTYNMDAEISLEDAFSMFLNKQPKSEMEPVVFFSV